MIDRYRKRPVVIQACEWTGYNLDELKEFCGDCLRVEYPTADENVRILTIKTLEGDMNFNEGDFIIRGIEGEFYPCKGDIFFKTYEEADGAHDERFYKI